MTDVAVFDEHAQRILAAGRERKLTVRLVGGLAIWVRSPQRARDLFARTYADIDLVGHRQEVISLREMLEELGYEPDREFNMLQGQRRLYYNSTSEGFHIDVFLDVFEMSHVIDLRERLSIDDLTIPAADLLLTKLQVAELNHKDVTDTAMLLMGHDLGPTDGMTTINIDRVCKLCGADWGLYTTVTDNLSRTRELLPELTQGADDQRLLATRIDAILAALDGASKTRSWRLRAKVGRRVRWYQVPDEIE